MLIILQLELANIVNQLELELAMCFAITLRASEAAAQCIVIGPVCLFVTRCVCACVCLWICYQDNSKLRASIFTKLSRPIGESSDHFQQIKFWPSCAPGRGSAAGRKLLALPYYSQRAVFASLSECFLELELAQCLIN